VRLGAAVSLSGPAAMAGQAQRNGLKLAQEEINTTRMLGDARLEIAIEDDASNREVAATVFQTFIENSRVVAILGPTLSDTALAVDPIAQQAGVPVLSVSNAAGGITQIGDFIFRDCLSEAQVLPQTVKRVAARFNLESAAVLYADTDTSRGAAHSFKKALHAVRVPLTAEQTFNPAESDFSAQLAEIASTNPEALFVASPPQAAAQILIQARRYGLAEQPIVGSNGFNSASVIRAAGEAAEGLIVGSGWSAADRSARNQQFMHSYRSRYGIEPDQFAAQAYSGVYIMAAALQDAGLEADPRALRDALTRIKKLETPLGPFSFNKARDAEYPATVQYVRNGKFELF
jgi:branched-chain amino acid transport system substrate-binding protein